MKAAAKAILFGQALPKNWITDPAWRLVAAMLLIIGLSAFGYGGIAGADAAISGTTTEAELVEEKSVYIDKEVAEADAALKPLLAGAFAIAELGMVVGYRYPDPMMLFAENIRGISISIMFVAILDLLRAARREARP